MENGVWESLAVKYWISASGSVQFWRYPWDHKDGSSVKTASDVSPRKGKSIPAKASWVYENHRAWAIRVGRVIGFVVFFGFVVFVGFVAFVAFVGFVVFIELSAAIGTQPSTRP